MANPEHLEILKQGVREWNKWRKEDPDERARPRWSREPPGANLELANLDGAVLVKAYLAGANLGRRNSNRANLDKANLSEADLAELPPVDRSWRMM